MEQWYEELFEDFSERYDRKIFITLKSKSDLIELT